MTNASRAASAPAQPPATVVTLGETMGLATQLEPGPVASNREMTLTIAGAESNVAIGIARLGGHAAWIGRVGDDEIGRLIQRELRAEGVRPLVHVDHAATGLMVKTRRTATTSQVTYYRAGSAGSRLTTDDLDADAIRHAEVLHISGITPALGDAPRAAVYAAIDIAHAAGTAVSLDVNYRSALWDRIAAATTLTDIARRCDIVFAGDDEARLLLPAGGDADAADDLTVAKSIAALGPSQAIIKLGARGCAGQIFDDAVRRDAIPVTVVDTVGAGDAFVAGYLTELTAGKDVPQRLTTAVTVAAFVVTGHGDWESLPTRRELALLTADDPVTR